MRKGRQRPAAKPAMPGRRGGRGCRGRVRLRPGKPRPIGFIGIGTAFAKTASELLRAKAAYLKIGFDNALGPHAAALSLRAQRTEVLAGNIANADTPGYQARDMDFKAELAKQVAGADETRIRTTHARHLPAASTANPGAELLYRSPLMGSFDGNSVDTQLEQAAFAQNNMQFQAALRFLNGRFQGLMSAVKGE